MRRRRSPGSLGQAKRTVSSVASPPARAQKSGRNDTASAAPVVLRQAATVRAPKAAKARWAPTPAPQGRASAWPETARAATTPTITDTANTAPRSTAAPAATSDQSVVTQAGSRTPDHTDGALTGGGGPTSGSTGRPQVGQNRAVAGNSLPQRTQDAIPAIVAAPHAPPRRAKASSTSATTRAGRSTRRSQVTWICSHPSRA